MALAFASALVVLIASGVAISRLGPDDAPGRSAETAAPIPAPDPTNSGSAGAGQEAAAPAADAANSSDAGSSMPAPVPPPVPARRAERRSAANPAGSPAGGQTATTAPAADAPASVGSESAGTPTQGSGMDGSGRPTPPSSQREPDSTLLAASVSVGEGTNGAVVGAGVGDRPETDVTVGDSKVVGDAPPSDGTAVDLGGRFLHPPPTVPTLPG